MHIYARHGILTHAPGFVSSFAGLHGSPRAGSYGPVTRSPYHWPLLTAGTKPCQTPPSNPGSGSRVSAPPRRTGTALPARLSPIPSRNSSRPHPSSHPAATAARPDVHASSRMSRAATVTTASADRIPMSPPPSDQLPLVTISARRTAVSPASPPIPVPATSPSCPLIVRARASDTTELGTGCSARPRLTGRSCSHVGS